MLLESEIAEEREVKNTQVYTPAGWRNVSKVYKTIPLEVYELATDSGIILRGSAGHMVYGSNGWTALGDITPRQLLLTYNGWDRIKYIRNTGKKEALYDITTDSPGGVFYSADVVSHNSTTFCVRQLMMTHLINNYKSLYVVPHFKQLETYGARFGQMEMAFRIESTQKNVYNKSYPNRSMINMIHCGETSQAARGKTADEVTIDECVTSCTKLKTGLDKTISICDIPVGAKITGFDENNERTTVEITAKKCNGYRRCYRIRTESGKELVCTGNHRLRTDRGWMYTIVLAGRLFGCSSSYGYGGSGRLPSYEKSYTGIPAGRSVDSAYIGSHCENCMHSRTVSARVQQLQTEAADPARSKTGNETKPRLRRRVGRNDDSNLHGLVSDPLRVLHKNSSWKDTAAEVCNSVVGRPTNMGSCSLVDMRRRFFKSSKSSLSDCHPFVFPGGDRPTDRMVSCEWCNWSEPNGSSQEGQNLFYHICRYGSFVCNSKPYSALCTSVHGVQGKYASFGVQASLRALWQGIHDDKKTVHYELEDRDVCMPGICMPEKASQCSPQKILRQPLSGCEERAMACKGKNGKAATSTAKICRKSPGGTSSETQGASQTCQGGPVHSKGGKETRGYDTCHSPYDLFLLRSGDVYNGMEAQTDSTLVDWENSMFEQGVSAAASTLQEGAPKILIETERGVEWDSVKSIEYAGVHEVWDITTTPHHTFFADGIGVHNCQSLNPDHVEDILYTLTDSKMPTKIFAGTALSIDTLLEAKWADSSMGMWHIRAMDDKHWLNMYDKDVLFKVCSNPQGPTCPYTGKLLNVTDGCFIHAYPERAREGRIGFHIPQCIIPDLAYDPIKWGAIYARVTHTDFKKVLQECFGIAIAEGSREITSQDLQRMCILTDTPDQLKQKCKEGYYRQIISGCDWGGSDYNPNIKSKTSYTVHCIIGLAPDNSIDILHYKRYSGMMYPDIAASIIKDHEDYKGNILASDFGVGLAYNMEIRKYLPIDKHFVIGYVGPKAEAVAVPKDAHLENQLSVNRTEAITNVFRDVKSMAPQKIRCRNWTEMQSYLNDWLNMFRVPTEDNTGRNTFKYIRAATKADDALHAFTFAYVMMKIFLGESLIQDPQLEAKLRQIMTSPGSQAASNELYNDMFGDPMYCISG